ncbi:MAG: protein phosphatase 2C domain-containing protein [Planctomycetes bacterium]|nr:protein phosphatase 2C domain-containing protein [Planctomycetota bacterium]
MWKHVAQSLPGPSHEAAGSVCQDSHLVRLLGNDDASDSDNGATETIFACVADGAGSADHSDVGSALTCQAIANSAEQYLESHGSFRRLQLDHVLSWFENLHEKLRSAADLHGCNFRELATTLCAAILSPEGSFFFQIGDGAITACNNGVYGVVFWPQSGEYANVTNFVTSDRFKYHFEFQATTSKISEIAIFTDGIERLALNFESRTPHLPFFQPLFQAVRSSTPGDHLAADLGKFLQSESVKNRSDDDKTLILATRLLGPAEEVQANAVD